MEEVQIDMGGGGYEGTKGLLFDDAWLKKMGGEIVSSIGGGNKPEGR